MATGNNPEGLKLTEEGDEESLELDQETV